MKDLSRAVANSFLAGTDGGPGDAPNITVYRAKTVCAAPGSKRNTISTISFVAEYACIAGAVCELNGVPLNSRRIDQFQFSCGTSNNYNDILRDLTTITINETVSFMTEVDIRCGICSPSFQPTGTHCVGK